MRKLILAVLSAWIAIGIIAPSAADAQGRRGDGQDRPRPQAQEGRRASGFSGMLNDIAGARLNRAHADKRSVRPPPNGKNQRQR